MSDISKELGLQGCIQALKKALISYHLEKCAEILQTTIEFITEEI